MPPDEIEGHGHGHHHHDLAIVSDTHLSAGYDRQGGTFARNEDFFYDDAFGRFVDHLLTRGRAEGRSWRLVLLGDVVDFLQVDLADESPGVTAAETGVRRLDAVIAGHPGFFAALGRLLAAGHRLDLVVGNHDVDFVWPGVHERLRRLLVAHAGADAAERFVVHPWLFYLPGVVYAEHGHQYDPLNAFLTPLAPFLPADPSLIELPLGSFFVRYLFNQVERVDPFADNVKPATRYLGWALRNHPLTVITTLDAHLRLFLGALRKMSDQAPADRAARRAAYRDAVLRPAAAAIGLPPDTLVAIDDLAAVPALQDPWEQLKALVLEPLGPAAALLASGVAAWRVARRLPPGGRAAAALLTTVGLHTWREGGFRRPATDPGGSLLSAARAIDDRLRAVDRAVPAYVFGHTHAVANVPLVPPAAAGPADPSATDTPRYLNCGTWTPIVPDAYNLVGARERFSFVELTRDLWHPSVRARLMLWNDLAGRAEPLPLFAP